MVNVFELTNKKYLYLDILEHYSDCFLFEGVTEDTSKALKFRGPLQRRINRTKNGLLRCSSSPHARPAGLQDPDCPGGPQEEAAGDHHGDDVQASKD